MFETAELGRSLGKNKYEDLARGLRIELIELQQALRKADFPVIIVFAGVDGAGKGETVSLLNEWMDPRWIVNRAYSAPTQEESERPEYWRYWRDLPPKGHIGIFLSSWYSRPNLDRVFDRADAASFDQQLDHIVRFERLLAEDGALILKFWMHLGRNAQKKRFEALEAEGQGWRVTETDWKHWSLYDQFVAAAERTIMRTSTGPAPWFIVEGANARYRAATVGTTIREALRKQLAARASSKGRVQASTPPSERADLGEALSRNTVLGNLDMRGSVPLPTYQTALAAWQARANRLQRHARDRGLSTVLVFEGSDAAGKGGAIRRLVGALDAREYQVIPIAAPTDEERAQHYLWRFWRHLGRAGRVTIFDRSWYGRVLVERVEGFASEAEWMRAYAEINHFEELLIKHGMVVAKFWLHVSPAEQLARFKSRQETPYKQWKLTEEDWRNRQKAPVYELAVDDMVERTSTRGAPWTLVAGDDKAYARLRVIERFCEALETRLRTLEIELDLPEAPPLLEIARRKPRARAADRPAAPPTGNDATGAALPAAPPCADASSSEPARRT